MHIFMLGSGISAVSKMAYSNPRLRTYQTDPRPIGHMHTYYMILSYQPNGSGISSGCVPFLSVKILPQPEVVPEAVIIKAHTSGAISNIMLDNRYVKC